MVMAARDRETVQRHDVPVFVAFPISTAMSCSVDFLTLASFVEEPDPAKSGRAELAHWLTNARNPLIARVMVNRVWMHLMERRHCSFGRQLRDTR